MKLKTDLVTLRTQRQLAKSTNIVEDASLRLATGKRINSAKDDAAGLSISSQMESGIRSKRTAQRSTNDAVSILQIAQSTAMIIQDSLIKMRELTVQAMNGTINDRQREIIDYEVHQLKQEIQRASENAKSNGRKLLDGRSGTFEIQVDKGNRKGDRVKIHWDDLAHGTEALGIFDVSVTTMTRAGLTLQKIDYAMKEVSKGLAEMGANQSRLQKAASKLTSDTINLEAAKSRIVDADVAVETSTITKEKIRKEASMNILKDSQARGSRLLKLLE